MGLYVYNRTVNGVKHYDVIDFNLPMTLSLYRLDDGFSENIFSWVPNENQWWITGFNPDYTEPSPHLMVTIGSVDFTGYEEMYENFKETYKQEKNANFIFDDDYHTVWILWEK